MGPLPSSPPGLLSVTFSTFTSSTRSVFFAAPLPTPGISRMWILMLLPPPNPEFLLLEGEVPVGGTAMVWLAVNQSTTSWNLSPAGPCLLSHFGSSRYSSFWNGFLLLAYSNPTYEMSPPPCQLLWAPFWVPVLWVCTTQWHLSLCLHSFNKHVELLLCGRHWAGCWGYLGELPVLMGLML